MRIPMILCAFLFLAGCDNAIFDSGIRSAVRATLKDPDSAKFGKELVYKTKACIEVNSKNSYGGYSGTTSAQLIGPGDGKWYLSEIDGEPCNVRVLEELWTRDHLQDTFEKKILGKLVSRGLVDGRTPSIYQIEDKTCRNFASQIAARYSFSMTDDGAEAKAEHRERAEAGVAKIDAGICK